MIKVRHKSLNRTGVALFQTKTGKICVRWNKPCASLDTFTSLHNLVFIVPAGRREIPTTHRPHEFLANRPGSNVCVCGCLKETTMHGYARPEVVFDALTGAWRLARPL